MFNAEVLSKFPVVQHFPFGSLFSWDVDPSASTPQPSIHMVNQPSGAGTAAAATAASAQPVATAAPWAQATRMPGVAGPGIPYSRAPGAVPGAGRGQGGADTGPTMLPPGPIRPSGPPGTAGNQIAVTKAPWAK